MSELRNLIARRAIIKAQVTRFNTYFDKSDAKDIVELEFRLQKLYGTLDEFNNIQLEIEQLLETVDPQQEIERDSFETLYFELVASAKNYMRINTPISSLEGNSTNNTQISLTNHVKLPTIQLPTFSGSYDQWFEFYDIFDSLIHKNQSINEVQKFHYLKSCLKNEAAQLIQSLEVTVTNYNIAWSLLRERFENKRLIVNNHIKSIFNIPHITKESHFAVRQMFDSITKNLRLLKCLGLPTESWDALIIHLISSKLDTTTRRECELKIPGTNLPTMEELTDFLKERCNLLETLHTEKLETTNSKSQFTKAHLSTNIKGCWLCKGQHGLYHCERFLKLSPTARIVEVKRLKLCLNCFKPNHFNKDCNSSTCKVCNHAHNTLLHINKQTVSTETNVKTNKDMNSNSNSILVNNHSCVKTEEVLNHSIINQSSQILLATTLLTVYDSFGKQHTCRALLDTGSQSNFATYGLCKKLHLSKQDANISIAGINHVKSHINHKVKICIQSRRTSFNTTISCLLLPSITGNLPSTSFDASILDIPANIQLADPTFNKANNIDLLLGASIFYELLCIGQMSLGKNKPILQKTLLGWILSGPMPLLTTQLYCNHSQNLDRNQDTDLQNQMLKFWEIEEQLVNSKKSYSIEQQECENNFINTTTRDIDGRFVVKIPMKKELNSLGESKSIALKRFYSMERKLNNNSSLKQQYVDFMREYLKLNHMTKVNENISTSTICYYLPHHPVLRETSLTTKLRVVFDGSCKTDTGISLNELQLVGPTIQDDLFAIVIRFRKHPIVMTADVAKMYRQILIDNSQRDLQRILWRENSIHPIECYNLNTVTYGTASAPYLAIRCLRQLAIENKSQYPIASLAIKQDFYVDDLLTGANTIDEAIILQQEIDQILKSAHFQLRKWSSNNKIILDNISSNCESNIINVGENPELKTLGIKWNSLEDNFQYSVKENIMNQSATKRSILSAIAQVYDPLGLLVPTTIIAKKIMQELWKLKVTWDESIQGSLYTEWLSFQSQLRQINKIKIPRHVMCVNPQIIELHGFCDSSETAYGACIYIKSIDMVNQVSINLLCAKSRVAPLKNISIPRLELCSAVLLAQLARKVKESIQIDFNQSYFWCDSTIVLDWINAPSYRWKTFIANRVSEIQTLTLPSRWKHVSTLVNPADLITRGLSSTNLNNSTLWWNGPDFLRKDSDEWPQIKRTHAEDTCSNELRSEKVHFSTHSEFYLFNKHSSLEKLKRIISYVLRFLFNSRTKTKEKRHSGQIKAIELNDALLHLIRIAQYESFRQDIHDLQTKLVVNPNSSLLKLKPFIDEKGLICVGRRLQNSDYDYAKKHPICLPPKHTITKLILKTEHEKLMHCGPQTLLSSVRESLWPLSGRSLARKIVHDCVKCFKISPIGHNQIMGNLPKNRVNQAHPFYNCGIDYAGPFLLRDKKSRGYKIIKSYICIFICFATKAMHLELVTDLTAETFIAALRRFCSRRGKPLNIYSDNATNFVKSNSEIQELTKFLANEKIKCQIESNLSQDGIQWHFIPPRSPHFGGLWEAGVKSVKYHLRRVFKDASLIYEEFSTVLTQIEAILNSRPLTPLSADPSDYNSLTPAHFLIGKPLTAAPDPNVLSIKENKLSTYQRLQQLVQHFWSRWAKEYISELQQRSKWNRTSEQLLKPEMLVIIKEDNIPTSNWKMGRIVEVHPGKDGIIRVVTVKTPTSVCKRAVSKICVLPIN